MFSLEVAVSIPLLNCIAYTYDIFFCLTSCIDVNKMELTVFSQHASLAKPFCISSKTPCENTTDKAEKTIPEEISNHKN